MSRRPSRSQKAGNRGRHRHIDSPETKAWEKVAETVDGWPEIERKTRRNKHGVPVLDAQDEVATSSETPAEAEPKRRKKKLAPPPDCPPYLRPEEYELLLELRQRL